MTNAAVLRTILAVGTVGLLASCAEVPTTPTAAVPTPPPAGYWNGDGVPGSPKIVVSISDQHAYFYKGKRLVGESTVSTGKPGFSTPPGHYTVVSKDKDHVSTVFGDYVDDFGNVVKSNIDSRKDRKPPGSHYDGARMPYAMFFRGGYAMHQGYVPPYAASHGCIRLPQGMAEPFFENAPLGTPVVVTDSPVESVSREQFNPGPPVVPASVSPPASSVVRPTAPASIRPASVRSPVPVPVRSPAPVLSRAPGPVPSPTPVLYRAPAPVPVRSPSPAPVRSPASVLSRAPAPVPSPTPVLSRAPGSVRPPAPVPVRSPSPASVRSPAPSSIRPTPAPVLSPTPGPVRSHRVHSRTHRRSPRPSPTPTPTPAQ